MVVYQPTDAGWGRNLYTELSALVRGQTYRVSSIKEGRYVVLEGFETTSCGGLYWTEFSSVEDSSQSM